MMLTGNGAAILGHEVGAVLQDQRHSALGVGLPVQGGGLADGEVVAAFGDIEGVPAALGGGQGRQGAENEVDGGAHGVLIIKSVTQRDEGRNERRKTRGGKRKGEKKQKYMA